MIKITNTRFFIIIFLGNIFFDSKLIYSILFVQGIGISIGWYLTCFLTKYLGIKTSYFAIILKSLDSYKLEYNSKDIISILVYDFLIHILPQLYLINLYLNNYYQLSLLSIICSFFLQRLWSLLMSNNKSIFYHANDIYNLDITFSVCFDIAYFIEFCWLLSLTCYLYLNNLILQYNS